MRKHLLAVAMGAMLAAMAANSVAYGYDLEIVDAFDIPAYISPYCITPRLTVTQTAGRFALAMGAQVVRHAEMPADRIVEQLEYG